MNAVTQTQPDAAVARAPAPNMELGSTPLMNPAKFEHMCRVGKMLALSPLFPEHLRKGGTEAAVANGVLVMNMAERLVEDPLTVAQNIYFVSGKPGWSATYMISKANQHTAFSDQIDWDVKGSGDKLSVTAFATLAKTGKKVSVTCDMAMAKAENWVKNAKYQSMPELMLRYRSATMLIRLYCPEVMIGMPPTIELDDETGFKDVTPTETQAPTAASEILTAIGNQDAEETPQASAKAKVDRTPPKPAEKPVEDVVEETPDKEIDTKTGEVLEAEKKPSTEKKAAPQKDEGPAGSTDYMQIANAIKADLKNAPSVSAVRDFYAAQLKAMQDEAFAVYKMVEKMFSEAEAAEEGEQP